MNRRREFKFIGELPDGYEYKIFQTNNDVKILGAHPDKEPICFLVTSEHCLKQIKFDEGNPNGN